MPPDSNMRCCLQPVLRLCVLSTCAHSAAMRQVRTFAFIRGTIYNTYKHLPLPFSLLTTYHCFSYRACLLGPYAFSLLAGHFISATAFLVLLII